MAHHWSVSQRVGSSDSTRVFLAEQLILQPGFPGLWLMFMYNWDFQCCTGWAFSVCMKPTLTSCESLWIYHSSPSMAQLQQISHRTACTFIISCTCTWLFASFSSCFLWLWICCTQCTQIYQDTSHLDAGGSSHSMSVKMWNYVQSVCWKLPLTCVEMSALCQLFIRERLPLHI